MIRFILSLGLLVIGFQAFAQKGAQPDTMRRKGGIVIMSNANFVTIQASQSKITIDNEGGITIESAEDIQIETEGDFRVEANDISFNASGDIAFTAGGDIETEATNTEVHSRAQTTISADAGLELESSATVNIGGALIMIGGSGKMPAARVGDPVVPDPTTGASQIITGSNTVLIGG
ncbi:MAG: PAAR domain-containing protein [Bacteroidia bacterium]